MGNRKKGEIFKKGVWIKEQQGALTMGSMDDPSQVMIVPESLNKMITEFEDDMIEALYGESSMAFDPEVLDFERVITNLKAKFKNLKLRISCTGENQNIFKGSYDWVFSLLNKLILSTRPESDQDFEQPTVYINASFIEDHLCIIFRDSGSISQPDCIKDEIEFLKNHLKGEISFKSTGSYKSYYDIMIPSQS